MLKQQQASTVWAKRVCEALVEASEVETEYPVASLLVLFCNEKSTLR